MLRTIQAMYRKSLLTFLYEQAWHVPSRKTTAPVVYSQGVNTF